MDKFYKQKTLPGVEGETFLIQNEKIPASIGPYKIDGLLDKGGMSTLYLGTHPETKETITVKVLLPQFLKHAEVVDRFLHEAEVIAIADHPNIVKLYGQGQWEGGLYIAMEFIEGVSLRHYLQHNPISLKHALEMVLEIAYAICHLHTHGIIHRDLKLENILITDQRKIKVIDFGIAQVLSEGKEVSKSSGKRVIGTPVYMSPEQRENPENVGYPSDIYSLGIITYELILGKLSHGKIHLNLVPTGIQKILSKALQPKPTDRYQDIVEFITDISNYLNSSLLESDKQENVQMSEVTELLHTAQNTLFPNTAPSWPHYDTGLLQHKAFSACPILTDFIALPNETYGLLMAKSATKSVEGVIYTAVFRGLLKSLLKTHPEPTDLALKINELLLEDPMHQLSSFLYVVFDPKKEEIRIVSIGEMSVFIIDKSSQVVTPLPAQKGSLGLNANPELSTRVHPFTSKDFLVALCSTIEIEPFVHDLLELSAQQKVHFLFRKLRAQNNKLIEEESIALFSASVHLQKTE